MGNNIPQLDWQKATPEQRSDWMKGAIRLEFAKALSLKSMIYSVSMDYEPEIITTYDENDVAKKHLYDSGDKVLNLRVVYREID